MTDPVANDNVPPAREASYRVLLAVVIILGVLIVLAFGALLAGFIFGVHGHSTAEGDKPWSYSLDVPAGTHVAGIQMDGNRVLVHLVSPDGEDLVVIDAASGRIVGRVQVKPPTTPPR